jgi:hypothetical protein
VLGCIGRGLGGPSLTATTNVSSYVVVAAVRIRRVRDVMKCEFRESILPDGFADQ